MKKGFTLIELMIVVAIIAILASVVWRVYNANNNVQCIGGYQFAVDYHLRNTQILDAQGHGIPCK